MEQKLALLPGELYFLATLMQAKYIDYAYVAAMDDIRKNYAIYESNVRSSLYAAGIVEEDFSGDLELNPYASAILRPIFFGEFESTIDVIALKDNANVGTYRFHSLDGSITMVHNEESKLIAETIDYNDINRIAGELLPKNYHITEPNVVDSIDDEMVNRLISVKNTVIGQSSEVKLYIDLGGVIYREKDENTVESMTAEMFTDDVLKIIKGA